MTRSTRTALVAIALGAAVVLSGCLLNTPSRVASRFLNAIKSAKWSKMTDLVDWETSRQVTSFPPKSEEDIIIDFVERLTGFSRIREHEKLRITHKFLYLRFRDYEVSKREGGMALVSLKMRRESRSEWQDVTLWTKKVDRKWRVVLTPNLFEARY